MSDNGFKYVKFPEYSCAFIASHKEVLNYFQAVDQQRHEHLVIKIGKEHSKWPKMVCYCTKPCTLKQSERKNVFQLSEKQLFLLPMGGRSLGQNDSRLHPKETESSTSKTSIPRL